MENREEYFWYLRCPSCFLNWTEKRNIQQEDKVNELCNFCTESPSSIQLLNRMISIMPSSSPSDFPAFIKHLIKHIDLKDI